MDIGVQEILLISVIALIVLGPERLPATVKTVAIWLGKIKRSFNDIKADIEREINADEIRQQIHNENVLHQLGEPLGQLKQTEQAFKDSLDDIDPGNSGYSDIDSESPYASSPESEDKSS